MNNCSKCQPGYVFGYDSEIGVFYDRCVKIKGVGLSINCLAAEYYPSENE